MSDFELDGLISFSADELTGGAEEASGSLESLADESDEASESLIDLDASGAAAGGALAGLGTGMQKAMDDTQDLREELNRAGQAAGFTQDEMVGMATSLSDATLDTRDAAGALSALAEQGVDTEAELERLASTSDDIADATGESATVVAEDLGPAMAAVGDDIEDMDQIADGVVATINETNLEFNDFTRTVERSREELNEMGLSTDETATLMGEFAEETGLSGRELRREFSSELEDADGDLAAFADSTGLNIESQDDLQDALADSQGATDSYSEAVSENTTLMDELRVGVSDATLQFADMLGPVSAAAPAMQTAGIAALTLSTVNFSALIPSLTGVVAAAAPLLIPLGALAAVAGVVAVAFGDDLIPMLEQFATDALDTVMSELGPVIDEFQKTASVLSDTFAPAFETTEAAVTPPVEAIGSVVETQFAIVTDVLEGIAILLRGDFTGAWEAATDTVSDVTADMVDALPSAEDARDAMDGFIDGVVDGIADRIPDVTGAVEDMTGEIREFLPFSPAERGPLSDLDESGESLPATLAAGVESNSGTVAGATGGMAGQATAGASGGGGLSASDIRSALEGMALSLSGGQLDLDGDVATMDQVDARLERAGREAELRGTQ